ncbi:MAG TPA: alpha/beta fold hydrolase [Stellaceae bacterium]|nr:alpha/beta fold hydrolase [Stellaceae bacterium]
MTVEMVRISTEDHARLDGALWSPATGTRIAVFLIPGGLRSEFFTMSEWAEMFSAAGYTALLLNQRDHGANYGLVTFGVTCDDIRYGVDFLQGRGAQRIILLGRSYGTVLVSCFLLKHHPLVKAGILYAPLRNIHQYDVDEIVATARKQIAEGHGDDLAYVPAPGPPGPKVAYSYRVLVDKLGEDSPANTVELLKALRGVPMLGIRDPADPLPGTVPPAQALLQQADPELDYVLMPDIRAGKKAFGAHFFEGREKEALVITLDWLKAHHLEP